MGDDAVKVAVRVRPFNNREVQMGAKLILKMNGGTTIITDPASGQPREFTFDYSYWSFDKNDPNFVDNIRVFNDLGNTVLQNAWEGYNVCLFAYGQTGAGKSYSMVGYGNDRGIVPLALEEMFERIKRNTDPNIKYQVEASMMEIYNEKVRDLFNPDNNPPTGLKVRDHPKLGPYVEDLSSCPVTNYAEVEKLMAEGTAARTVAATQMNNSSSRAHTIFQIMLTTTTHDVTTNKDTSKVSKINLVDLAGSERVAKTGATGQQMKEGININKSLSVLGDCIEKLAKRAKDKGVHVPYRNSVLTWLLKQSLGGNSKTIMIAALSPADDNFDETLSTLRYADRAKQICNQAVVNEDENAKIIRSLRKEIEALKAQLTGGAPVSMDAAGGGVMSEEEKKKRDEEREEFERMKERMKQNEEIMKRMNMTWEEKMKEAQAAADKRSKAAATNLEQRKTTPHLVNLHQDMLLAETLTHFFPEGTIRICRQDIEPPPGPDDIVLKGLLVQKENAEVTNSSSAEGKVIVDPKPDARIFINGILIKEPTELNHNDRVIIGAHHVFRFVHPLHAPQHEENAESDSEKYNWQFAQKELTEAAMSSLAPIVDDETKKQQEEAQRKMKELEEQIAKEKEAALQAQLEKQREFEEMMRVIAEQKEKELAEARERMSQEADAKTQAELQAVLEAKERDLEKEKQAAQQEFQRQQEEMAKAQAELEKKLAEQQRITETLQRKKEIENRDKVLLEESLMRTIPMVNEANAMCDELKQNLRFQIKLMAKKSTDANAFTEKTQVFVKVHDVSEGLEVFWDNDVFNENLFLMREIYNAFQEEGVLRLTDENNPFHIQCDGPQLLGNCRIYLQPVYYLFPIDEKTPIIDYKGESQGQLSVKLLPIPNKDPESDAEDGGNKDGKEKDGKPEEEEYFFDEENVEELKGQMLEMRLEINKAMGLPQKFSSQVHCVYKFFLDEKELRSKATEESSINPTIGYSRTILIDPVTDDFVEYLKSGLMEIQVWGQRPTDEQKKSEEHRRRQGSIITDQDRAELEEVKKALLALDIPTHARGMSVSQQVNSLVTSLKTRVDSPEPLSPMVYGNFDDSPMPTRKSFNFASGRASPDDSAVSYETKDGSLAPMVTVSPPQPDPVLVQQLEQKAQAVIELQQKVEQQAQELERLRSEHASHQMEAPNSSEALAAKVALEKQIIDMKAEQAKLTQRESEWVMEKARIEAFQQEKEKQWAMEREKLQQLQQKLQAPAPAPDAKPVAVEISKELQYELEKLRQANLALLRSNQDMQAKLATQKDSKACTIL